MGINISGSLDPNLNYIWFETESCISWDDHVGVGRVTSGGIGAGFTVGAIWIDTSQTYQNISGIAIGVNGSATTTGGRWFFRN